MERVLRGLLPVTAGASDGLDAAIDERCERAAALVDGGLDDAIVEGPGTAIVDYGDWGGGGFWCGRGLGRLGREGWQSQNKEGGRKKAEGAMQMHEGLQDYETARRRAKTQRIATLRQGLGRKR